MLTLSSLIWFKICMKLYRDFFRFISQSYKILKQETVLCCIDKLIMILILYYVHVKKVKATHTTHMGAGGQESKKLSAPKARSNVR